MRVLGRAKQLPGRTRCHWRRRRGVRIWQIKLDGASALHAGGSPRGRFAVFFLYKKNADVRSHDGFYGISKVLLHYHNIYFSSQGGKNTTLLRLPPQAVAHGSDVVYTRQKGSRTEPDGNVFTVMKCDDVCTSPVDGTRRSYVDTSTLPQDEVPVESMLYYTETGRLTDKRKAGNAGPKDPHTGLHTDASLDSVDSSQSSQSSLSGSMEWVLTSNDFGQCLFVC